MTNIKVIVKRDQLNIALGGCVKVEHIYYTSSSSQISISVPPDEITLEIPVEQIEGEWKQKMIDISVEYGRLLEEKEQKRKVWASSHELEQHDLEQKEKPKTKRYLVNRVKNFLGHEDTFDNGCFIYNGDVVELEPLEDME